MALLNILEFPDPRLRNKAQPVPSVTPAVQQLADDMLETMYAAPGIGLAAIQVNEPLRLLVCDVSEDNSAPLVIINPEILAKDGEEEMQEGCLSVPGFHETVRRADVIDLRYLDRDGVSQELHAEGLLAVCIQHEIDHLDGKLFVDYLSSFKRNRIQKKLEKLRKQSA